MTLANHTPSSRKAAWVLMVLVCAAFVGHALFYLFLQDDAYIFFRYADNWIDGLGPVWNQGERVEGYTSPAWLALLATLRLTTGAFEPGIHVISLGFGVATLILIFFLGRSVCRDQWAGLAAAILIASDRTFAVWSTSGMETRLFGFMVLATAFLVWRRSRAAPVSRLEAFSFGPTLLLLCLTRPEGFLFSAFAVLFLLVAHPTAFQSRWGNVGLALWVVGISSHFLWRLNYYGEPLPNTFYAKVPGLDFHAGYGYLTDFANSFPVFSIAGILAVIFHLGKGFLTRSFTFGSALSATILVYLSYLAAVGGGFMEFRMLDAVIAPASILIVATLWPLLLRLNPKLVSVSALAVAIATATVSLNGGMHFEDQPHVVMTRTEMWDESTKAWILVGKFFGRNALPGESLATTAAGAIPYYSRMLSVDQLGLNDHYIARLQSDELGGVGHRKMAPESYLDQRGVTFVIGHPRLFLEPNTDWLRPEEFFVHVEDPSGIKFFLAVRTKSDRETLIASLRDRGVTVVDPLQS